MVSNNLKEIRLQLGYTQEELARLCDCTLRTIQNIENNKNCNPGIETVLKIKKALNINIEDIFKLDYSI